MKKIYLVLIALLLLPTYSFGATFGYTTLGASADSTNSYALSNSYTATTCDPVTAYYGGSITAGTASVYVAIYDFGDGDVSSNNRLDVSSAMTVTTVAAFRSAAISGTDLVNGTTYFIETYSNTANVQTRYSATAGFTWQTTPTAVATPPVTHAARDGTGASHQVSVYVDCAASTAVTPYHKTVINNVSGVLKANHSGIIQ